MSTKPMKKADEELDKALAESFPASDPVSLTRASHRPASRADRKAPKVIRSAEGQPDKKP